MNAIALLASIIAIDNPRAVSCQGLRLYFASTSFQPSAFKKFIKFSNKNTVCNNVSKILAKLSVFEAHKPCGRRIGITSKSCVIALYPGNVDNLNLNVSTYKQLCLPTTNIVYRVRSKSLLLYNIKNVLKWLLFLANGLTSRTAQSLFLSNSLRWTAIIIFPVFCICNYQW